MGNKKKSDTEVRKKISQKTGTDPSLAMSEMSPRKKRIFAIATALLPLLLLLFLELLLVLLNYGGNTDLFIPAPSGVSQYMMINRNVGRRFFFMQSTLPTPQKDLMLRKKPANGYRIFVMGGSTTAGFPFGNNIMFSRILHFRLADAFPDKTIEVINVGMSAINSYTLLGFMDELLAQEPDAILIYAGHNEYYGALGVASMESLGKHRGIVKAYLGLEQLRTFLLIRDAVGWLRRTLRRAPASQQQNTATATLMERIVSDTVIPSGSRIYELGQRQFRENLREIIRLAQQARVPVITSELVCNVKDQKPFESLQTAELPAAAAVFEYAEELHEQGKFAEARAAYYRAKDLDVVRFRAPEDFNAIIHVVSDEYQVPVVPMKRYFEEDSPNGLIGDNLMVDHLHPNIQGCFIMANAFFQTLREHYFIADRWDAGTIRSSEDYLKNWGITQLDTLAAELSIRYLKGSWPFQPKSSRNRSLDDYHPTTKTEEIAYEVLTREDVSIEIGHVQLAEYFIGRKAYEAAYREYRALIYMIPYEVSFYENAAEMLLKLNRYDEALPILLKSLHYNDNFFANKWSGQIYLIKGDPVQAAAYMEKALNWKPFDDQLLFNLTRAYIALNNRKMALQYYEKLRRIARDSDYVRYLEKSLSGTSSD